MRRSQLQVLTLVVMLVWPSLARGIQVIHPAQQQVEAFGFGTEVRVLLQGGETLRGSIGPSGEDYFDLLKGKSPVRVYYSLVNELDVLKATYPSSSPRSGQVRKAIELLQGQTVKIKLVSKKTREGVIHRPTAEGFELLPDKKSPIPVIYADVVEVFPQFPTSRPSLKRRIGGIALGVGTALLIHLVCKGKTGCLL